MALPNTLRDLDNFFQSTVNSLLELEEAASEANIHPSLQRMITRFHGKLEELRYVAESLPILSWNRDDGLRNLQERKDLYTARLLTIVLLQKAKHHSKTLTERIAFHQLHDKDIRDQLQQLMQLINHLEELMDLQERLSTDASTNTQLIKKLEQKYAKRIEELESKLTETETKVLEIDELIAKGKLPKKRFLRKKKFMKALADLIARNLTDLQAELGAVTTVGTLYKRIQEKHDLDLDLEDVIDACEILAAKGIIPGITSLSSGMKVIELQPVELDPDQHVVLQLASEKGYVTVEDIILRTNWDEYRARRILEYFENNKIARYVQSFEEGERWYFPGLSE